MTVGAVALASCSRSTTAPAATDTPWVLLATVQPDGREWEMRGARRAGSLCVTLRGADGVLGERCGEERTALRTWEVSTFSAGSRVVVFAPLPPRARRVRLDGLDGSLMVVEAQTAPGFPGRFLLAEVDAAATPKEVRVFAAHGRAVVPDA